MNVTRTNAGGSAVLHDLRGKPAAEAAARLFEVYGERVFGLGLRVCGNASDAEDVVQETFLQVYRRWETFRGEASAGTWVYAIAARVCKGKLRKRRTVSGRMPSMSQVLPWAETTVADLAEDGNPVGEAVRREAEEAVHDAIRRLPEAFRVPVVLKEMLELSVEEVGEVLGLKPETVKTRVHRARLLLRGAMMKRVPTRSAPDPAYDKRVCLDLLKAKLEAMDRGRGFPIGQSVVCDRCRSVFAELDLAQNACAMMETGAIPAAVRGRIERAIAAAG